MWIVDDSTEPKKYRWVKTKRTRGAIWENVLGCRPGGPEPGPLDILKGVICIILSFTVAPAVFMIVVGFITIIIVKLIEILTF